MNKLWVRLSLGFSGMVLVAVFLVAASGIFFGQPNRRFGPSIISRQLIAEMANYYEARQSWAGSEFLLQVAQTVLQEQLGRRAALFLADANRQVIYHQRRDLVGQPLDQVRSVELVPIRVEGQIVGYLGVSRTFIRRPDAPLSFLELLGRVLVTVAAVAGLGGIVFGILMSRSLTAPLNRLAEAARAIGARNLSQRVEEKGSDEMIAVARAFNEMAADLEQAEQLRRNLLTDVAHELRTPLSVLQGNLRAILDEVYPLNQEEMARLYEHSRLLSRLVNDLHVLAQAEARRLPLDLEATDLTQLIKRTGETFRPSAEAKGVALQIELPRELPVIEIDAARITQVLQNLLANALRHTPAGGTITIRAEATAEAIQVSVTDTGEGIPPEHLPHIFDRFYRSDPARSRDRGGAGLGLAIARAMAEMHGGQIEVTSPGVPGQGSTFTIYLPLDDA